LYALGAGNRYSAQVLLGFGLEREARDRRLLADGLLLTVVRVVVGFDCAASALNFDDFLEELLPLAVLKARASVVADEALLFIG